MSAGFSVSLFATLYRTYQLPGLVEPYLDLRQVARNRPSILGAEISKSIRSILKLALKPTETAEVQWKFFNRDFREFTHSWAPTRISRSIR